MASFDRTVSGGIFQVFMVVNQTSGGACPPDVNYPLLVLQGTGICGSGQTGHRTPAANRTAELVGAPTDIGNPLVGRRGTVPSGIRTGFERVLAATVSLGARGRTHCLAVYGQCAIVDRTVREVRVADIVKAAVYRRRVNNHGERQRQCDQEQDAKDSIDFHFFTSLKVMGFAGDRITFLDHQFRKLNGSPFTTFRTSTRPSIRRTW